MLWKKMSGKNISMEQEEERRIRQGCSNRSSNGGICIRKEVRNMGANEWWQRGMAYERKSRKEVK